MAAVLMAACCACDKKPAETPKEQLTGRLLSLAENGQIAYGHQDDLAYGHSWCVEDYTTDPLERSDVKAVTGKYPMVLGFELGGIELGNEKNLDGVPFGLMLKGARKHIERGGIVTFSWHPRNPVTGGDAWDVSSDQAVKAVLPGGDKYEQFQLWLERAADFFEELGPEVSVIFRPWHENSGSWFWWGEKLCTAQEYRDLFRLTWEYFNERGLDNLIWCYSPNGPFSQESYLSRYPGDDVVDLLGADLYEFVGPDGIEASGARFTSELSAMLDTLTSLGQKQQKPICLSETGFEGIPDPEWWTGVLLPAIVDYPITYVLTWRNASDRPGHFYAAWEGFEGAPDMKAFSENEHIAFLNR